MPTASASAALSAAAISSAASSDEPGTMPSASAAATVGASSATGSMMLPPPEGTFSTRQEVLDFALQHALSQGYATSIHRSIQDRYVYIQCDRGGQYRDRVNSLEGAKRRRTSTRLVGCPFSLYTAKRKDNLWYLRVKNPSHNHGPDDNMIAHPAARKLNAQQLQMIKHLASTRASPRNIIDLIKKDTPTQLVIQRDIYNQVAAIRRQKLGKQKAPPKCSNCGEIGHTIRKCLMP